jgi:hypothetical protein
MSHVVVKLWPGESEEQKTGIAKRITEAVMNVVNYVEESLSGRGAKSNPAIRRMRPITRAFAVPPRSSTGNPDMRCEQYEQILRERSSIHSLSLMHSLWIVGTARASEQRM